MAAVAEAVVISSSVYADYRGIPLKPKCKISFKVSIFSLSLSLSRSIENQSRLFAGCKIRQTVFTTNEQGRASGECFVTFESSDDISIAKNFDKKSLGNREFKSN